MYPTPSAAVSLIYNALRDNGALNEDGGVAIYNDQELKTDQDGIRIFVSSPGSNTGLTDGSRDYITPLITVVAISASLDRAEILNAEIMLTCEGLSGSSPFGRVVRVAQRSPYHNTIKTPSNVVRYVVGGIYETHIVAL